jgi:hypothetical protein
MAFKTMQELVTKVERYLYQSAGPQVQIYSQDLLVSFVQNAFNHVFNEEFWPHFVKREQRTLDGSTGTITSPLTHIIEWRDIYKVFRDGSRTALPHMPLAFNTIGLEGATPRFIEARSDSSLFTVYPTDATGDVLVIGRARPASDFAYDEEVPFDEDVIAHFAAWQYFVDDENAPSADKHRQLFEQALKRYRDNVFSHSVQLDPMMNNVPDRWSEVR